MRSFGWWITLATLGGVSAWRSATAGRRPEAGWPVESAEARELAPPARRLAVALADAEVRSRLDSLLGSGGRAAVGALVPGGDCLTAWFPVPAHLDQWRRAPAGPLLIVAGRTGIPLAFDREGRIHRLDPTRPPRTPALVLSRVGASGCAGSWLCAAEPGRLLPRSYPSSDGSGPPGRPAPCVLTGR
jgi:hypothetical protein